MKLTIHLEREAFSFDSSEKVVYEWSYQDDEMVDAVKASALKWIEESL